MNMHHVLQLCLVYVKGNGYESFLLDALSFLKSTQILNLLMFFLNTIIIGDIQVASSIGYINIVANNLSMSYLTSAT
jgi:hypothetical protein